MKAEPTSFDRRMFRLARLVLELRQRDLAQALGVPPQRISDWEQGLRRPSAQQFDRLVQALTESPRQDNLLASQIVNAVTQPQGRR